MDDQNFNDPKVAQEWIQNIESDHAKIRTNDIYPRIKHWVTHFSPSTLLDIGAGQGICSDYIGLSNDQTYTGLEPSSFLIDRAKSLYPQHNRKFIQGTIYKIPFLNSTFDAVFSVSVWHLLSDLKLASSELSRTLKDNGNFLIITANPESYSFWTSKYSNTTLIGRRFEGDTLQKDTQTTSHDVLYLHTLDEITSSLKFSGLKIDKIEPFRPTADNLFQYISIQGKK